MEEMESKPICCERECVYYNVQVQTHAGVYRSLRKDQAVSSLKNRLFKWFLMRKLYYTRVIFHFNTCWSFNLIRINAWVTFTASANWIVIFRPFDNRSKMNFSTVNYEIDAWNLWHWNMDTNNCRELKYLRNFLNQIKNSICPRTRWARFGFRVKKSNAKNWKKVVEEWNFNVKMTFKWKGGRPILAIFGPHAT